MYMLQAGWCHGEQPLSASAETKGKSNGMMDIRRPVVKYLYKMY